MIHHPHALPRYSIAISITGWMAQFWIVDPDQISKVPKQTSGPCFRMLLIKASMLHVFLLDRSGDQGMFRLSVLLSPASAEVLPHRVALHWR
jgi:hypothetical protein